MDKEYCKHVWVWPHGTISGRRPNEVAIVRRCATCGTKQVAFIHYSQFRTASGDYALDEHYDFPEQSK